MSTALGFFFAVAQGRSPFHFSLRKRALLFEPTPKEKKHLSSVVPPPRPPLPSPHVSGRRGEALTPFARGGGGGRVPSPTGGKVAGEGEGEGGGGGRGTEEGRGGRRTHLAFS